MKSLFKRYQSPVFTQQALLSRDELHEIQIQAEQLQSSVESSHQLESRESGWLPTQHLGCGIDYSESRIYQHGDDPRYINWRLSARSTETYMKTFHIESRPSICILLDQRRSMIFGTRQRLKTTQALRIASMLAYIADKRNITLKIMLLHDEISWLGEQTVEAFLGRVNLPCSIAANNNQPALTSALEAVYQKLQKGSLLYILSDFLDANKTTQESLSQLQQQCFVQTIHIVDPAEQNLSAERSETTALADPKGEVKNQVKGGGVSLQDMYSDDSVTLNTNTMNDIENSLQSNLKQLKEHITKSGVCYSQVLTHEDKLYPHIALPLGH